MKFSEMCIRDRYGVGLIVRHGNDGFREGCQGAPDAGLRLIRVSGIGE